MAAAKEPQLGHVIATGAEPQTILFFLLLISGREKVLGGAAEKAFGIARRLTMRTQWPGIDDLALGIGHVRFWLIAHDGFTICPRKKPLDLGA